MRTVWGSLRDWQGSGWKDIKLWKSAADQEGTLGEGWGSWIKKDLKEEMRPSPGMKLN